MNNILLNGRKIIIKGILCIFFVQILMFIVTCSKKQPLEPENKLPSLTDPIPFNKLGTGTIVFERTGTYPGEYSGCYVIDVNQKIARALKLPPSNKSGYCVSPNGEKIAFTMFSDYESLFDVYIVNIDGTNLLKLDALLGQDRYPSWLPNSNKVLFWVDDIPICLYIKTASQNSQDLTIIKEYTDHFPSGRFSVSVDEKIAYVSDNNFNKKYNGLNIMEMDGSNRRLLVSHPEGRFFESPEFSPDGKKIAFLSVLPDSSFNYKQLDLYTVEVTGENLKLISSFDIQAKEWAVNGKFYGVSVAWSPDGTKLLFNRPEGDFISHLYLINSDGTGLTQITSAEGVTDRCVSWSR